VSQRAGGEGARVAEEVEATASGLAIEDMGEVSLSISLSLSRSLSLSLYIYIYILYIYIYINPKP